MEGLTRESVRHREILMNPEILRIKSGNILCLSGVCVDSQTMKTVKPSCIIYFVSVHCHMQIFMTNLKNIKTFCYIKHLML